MKYTIMLNITNDLQHIGHKEHINKNLIAEFNSDFSFKKGNEIIIRDLYERIKIKEICYIFENMNITETILHCVLFKEDGTYISQIIEHIKKAGFRE